MDKPSKKNFSRGITIATLLVSLIVVGTVGYGIFLRTSFIDSLYMTIITISTVGYTEVAKMDADAKLFSIFLIFAGVGIVGYSFTTLVVMIVEGKIKEIWRNRVMDRRIEHLKDHYIVCGGGETGEVIIEEFNRTHVPFVIIEKNEEVYNKLIERDINTIFGDATSEVILEKAGIQTAKGLISDLKTDADNIVCVLTARTLNQDIHIISRAIEKSAPEKLIKVGADKTISTAEIEGKRMAAMLLRPAVVSFLDLVNRVGDTEMDMEDIIINQGSFLDNKSLKEGEVSRRFGTTVLAIKKKEDKKPAFNPDADYTLKDGDMLIVLGTPSQIEKIREAAGDSGDR